MSTDQDSPLPTEAEQLGQFGDTALSHQDGDSQGQEEDSAYVSPPSSCRRGQFWDGSLWRTRRPGHYVAQGHP